MITEKMKDAVLAEVQDWLFAERIESFAVRSGDGEARTALVINQFDVAEVRAIIEDGGSPCSVEAGSGVLAFIRPVTF
jgi:hypothetical protein